MQISNLLQEAIQWYYQPQPPKVPERVCATRDIFQARVDRLYRELIQKTCSEDEAALLVAMVGELGNNCFDHNLGQWVNEVGCWFAWELQDEGFSVIIADRGQGILNSLKRVQPQLDGEAEALKIAFEKQISGRSPEQRGNGLKFVCSVINGNSKRGLLFYSGSASVEFGGVGALAKTSELRYIADMNHTGTFAWLVWRKV